MAKRKRIHEDLIREKLHPRSIDNVISFTMNNIFKDCNGLISTIDEYEMCLEMCTQLEEQIEEMRKLFKQYLS